MKKTYKNEKGFSHFEAILLLLIVAAIATVGVYVAKNRSAQVSATNVSTAQPSEVYRWGLYLGAASHTQNLPTAVPGLTSISAISASNDSNYALQCVGGTSSCATDGVVWAWGNNNAGELGNGTKGGSTFNPVRVNLPIPAGVGVVAIGEARDEGYAIDANGQAYAWGDNGSGALCIGNSKQQDTPVKIPGITTATAVQGGQEHVLFLLSNGKVVACGKDSSGQLGIGTTKGSNVPIAVTGLSNIVQISAGNLSSAALDSSGNVYMWGGNNHGQVGAGSIGGFYKLPVRVALPASATEVYAGGDLSGNGQTFALLSNNTVYSWGDNNNGQLGDGNNVSTGSPVMVRLPSGVIPKYVATGGAHSLMLDSNGNVWGWGGKVGTSSPAYLIDRGVDMISTTANNSLDHH